MILFNPNQFQDLKNLIRKDILKFISDNIGKKYLLDNDKDFLKSQGVDVSKFTEAENTVFNLAFKFGMYSNNTNFHKAKNLSLNDFEKIVKSNKFMPLTAKEESSLDSITYEGVRDIRNLSDRIGAKVEIKLSEVEKKRKIELETIVHDAAKRAILKRETVKEFASELLHITGDTSRDWLRVAQFNLHSCHNAGIATELQRLYGNDALCYKHVYADSCKYCEDKYFENGFGSKPKIYKLSELVANGTNIGIAKKDWKPVVGSEHPYCYPQGVEILTDIGWLLFENLIGDEKILSMNLDNYNAEWVNIKNKIEYEYSGKLHHLKHHSFEILCTPNHHHVINTSKTKKFRLVCGDEMPKGSKFNKTILNWQGENTDFIEIGSYKFKTDIFVEFMAYYLSEGCFIYHKDKPRYEIKITQQQNNIKSHYKEISDCCDKLFNNVNKGKNSIYICIKDEVLIKYFQQFGKCNNKFIPNEIKMLAKKYLIIFLNAYAITDGYIKKGKNWKGSQFSDAYCFFTSSNQLASDLGELILKVGKSVSYFLTPIKTTQFKNGIYTSNNPIWTIQMNNQITALRTSMTENFIDYNGIVRCVELEKNGNMFVRYNGKVFNDGNCRCTLVDLPPHYQYDEKIKKFAPVYDTEGAMKRIRAFEQRLREAKGKRGEWDILKKSLYSDLALNKVKEHKETAKIPSYYKVVNEYENKFNMAFAKMLGQTMENLIKML